LFFFLNIFTSLSLLYSFLPSSFLSSIPLLSGVDDRRTGRRVGGHVAMEVEHQRGKPLGREVGNDLPGGDRLALAGNADDEGVRTALGADPPDRWRPVPVVAEGHLDRVRGGALSRLGLSLVRRSRGGSDVGSVDIAARSGRPSAVSASSSAGVSSSCSAMDQPSCAGDGGIAMLSGSSPPCPMSDVWLAIAVVIASGISAYFYLRVVAVMYFSPSELPEIRPVRTQLLNAGLILLVVGNLALGLFSSGIVDLSDDWTSALTNAPTSADAQNDQKESNKTKRSNNSAVEQKKIKSS